MIKLIIFDLDGVLVDAKELHYEALNNALASVGKEFLISRQEHIFSYDGLATREKLNKLTKERGLPQSKHDFIWNEKQKETVRLINEMRPDARLSGILKQLQTDGYIICVASNAVRNSVKLMLLKRGLMEFVDFFVSNEDVDFCKPKAEIYLRCMIQANCDPKETVIFEDSVVGRQAAQNSGAFVCGVKNSEDITYEKIVNFIGGCFHTLKWHDDKLKILIPMAGTGSRFTKAGYKLPKPLINVRGKPMIQTVVENLRIDAKYIFLVQKSHYEMYNLSPLLNCITNNNCEIMLVDGITEGAACTTLLAKKHINNNDPLLIVNADQFIEWDSSEFMYYTVCRPHVDASILTFRSNETKWSYALVGESGFVSMVAEKEVISNLATVGVYYWRRGVDYVKCAENMIKRNIRINNEFYVCPVFNQAIEQGMKITVFDVKSMWGMGTPEDLQVFLKNYSPVL